MIIKIYWKDLPKERQDEFIAAIGEENALDIFPITVTINNKEEKSE